MCRQLSPKPVVEERHLDLLRDLGTHAHAHTGRTLFDHLLGTARLLESWGNPPEVCLAGLYHSIYGTQSYRVSSLELTERDRVRDLIGERGEWLAYLFCVTDRSSFFSEAGTSPVRLRDRVHEATIDVRAEDLTALLEIEVANYLEFMPRIALTSGERQKLRENVERGKAQLSVGAYEAATAMLEKTGGYPET